jgi:hypothetical protein
VTVVVTPGAVVVVVVVTGTVTVVVPAEVRHTPPGTHRVCGVACALASTSIGPTITAESAAQPPRMARICLFRGNIVIPLAFPEPGMPEFSYPYTHFRVSPERRLSQLRASLTVAT